MEYGKKLSLDYQAEDVSDIDPELYEYFLDHMSADIQPGNRFFVSTDLDYASQKILTKRKIVILKDWLDRTGYRSAVQANLFYGGMDFGHTCPGWNEILPLGIAGLRARALSYASKTDNDPKQQKFYDNVVRVYDAARRYMERAAAAAEKAGKTEMAEGIRNLLTAPPKNLFEAMQTTIIYYMLQHTVESSMVRTFGRLDLLFYPYFLKETDREKTVRLLEDYVDALEIMDPEAANLPFAIGGYGENGESAVNELSYLLLDAYKKKPHPNVKLHLMFSPSTPKELVESALDGVRKGNNSICFLADDTVKKSLMNIGASERDAANYAVLGCYEAAAYGEIACTSAGKMNLPKSLEVALFDGKDLLTGKEIGLPQTGEIKSFEDLFSAFETELRYSCRHSIEMANMMESNSRRLHAAPFFSSSFDYVMQKGGDIYNDHLAKYNNTSVIGVGLATCVDSLIAIKKLVYDEKKLSLDEFREILKNNWEGEEVLRQTVKNTFPKYGQGDPESDALAARVVRIMSEEINNHPNTKGGVFRLGMFSITWRWAMGEKTGASADGRLAGETLSLNTGASFGAAKNGLTAHFISVGSIGNEWCPNGSICDIDLHISAVAGEKGLHAMYASLLTFAEMGGFSVHYNVLDSEVLKKAKENPELYPDLQVRLCGWNVRFNSLSEKEKDEFIARFDAAE